MDTCNLCAGGSIDYAYQVVQWATAKCQNVYMLKVGNPVTIDNQRFIGDTLWFPDTLDSRHFRSRINDFAQIADCALRAHDKNAECVRYLYDQLRPDDVVITHHLPHRQSVAPQYVGDPLNCYFLSDMSALIR